jgi:hypothetical protein
MQADRKSLSHTNLISEVSKVFSSVKDPQQRSRYSIKDCLLCGLALFALKYPSLLQMNDSNDIEEHNLRNLYKIRSIPSDTHFRVRLDKIEYTRLQYAFDALIARLQRGKLLLDYRYLEDSYLVSIDGTGYFSSDSIHCDNCCVKHHAGGKISYYHQMLSAVMVHPGFKQVFPLALEPIMKQDGSAKNDCERNAAMRLLKRIRISHPHMKITVLLDALYANGPLINLLDELGFKYIITAKNLKDLYDHHEYGGGKSEGRVNKFGTSIEYKYSNNLPLNQAHSGLKVNLLQVVDNSGKRRYQNDWITNIDISKDNVYELMKGGRARWRIENETFNTLKNLGYNFEHNFGHGYNNLSIVLCYMMFIAFTIDQVQAYCGYHFKMVAAITYAKIVLWERLRACFMTFEYNNWEEMYIDLYNRRNKAGKKLTINTS